jgi:hypothetical protein
MVAQDAGSGRNEQTNNGDPVTFPERTQIKRFGGPIGQIAAMLFVAASQPAYAGRIAVDFGENESTGQDFSTTTTDVACAGAGPASCELSLTGN